MAKVVGVGQVAEWSNAAVLKTALVNSRNRHKPHIFNTYRPRKVRISRIVRRFTMAQKPSHIKKAPAAGQSNEGDHKEHGAFNMADNFPKPILPFLEGKIGELRKMRFWSKVDMRGPGECWDWQASTRGEMGYGRFKVASYQTVTASRFALIATTGTEPAGKHVLHSCDRPICCNPHHLRFGSVKENAADKVGRGRAKNGILRGTDNPRCKLTDEQFGKVVSLLKSGKNNKQIAAVVPVTHSMVSRIRVGKAWVREAAELGWSATRHHQMGLAKGEK